MIAIQKNQGEQIRIGLAEFSGRHYADIRVYFLNDNREWTPTKKGVAVKPELLDEVIAALIEVRGELTEAGLLEVVA